MIIIFDLENDYSKYPLPRLMPKLKTLIISILYRFKIIKSSDIEQSCSKAVRF